MEGFGTITSPKPPAKSIAIGFRLNRLSEKSSQEGSVMSMLNFYMNRAGNNLAARRRKVLQEAKIKLRNLFQK